MKKQFVFGFFVILFTALWVATPAQSEAMHFVDHAKSSQLHHAEKQQSPFNLYFFVETQDTIDYGKVKADYSGLVSHWFYQFKIFDTCTYYTVAFQARIHIPVARYILYHSLKITA